MKNVLFIPYASANHDAYTKKVKEAFKRNTLEFDVIGINEVSDPKAAVQSADAVYIGGGNTFLLLHTLYKENIVELIRNRVMKVSMKNTTLVLGIIFYLCERSTFSGWDALHGQQCWNKRCNCQHLHNK